VLSGGQALAAMAAGLASLALTIALPGVAMAFCTWIYRAR
jgi:hypothetical protein